MIKFLESGTIIVPVGSRVTCSPPPKDADEDFLLLVESMSDAVEKLKGIGFIQEDETEPEYDELVLVSFFSFTSLRLGNVNYIITQSYFFFERFLTATRMCQRLNLRQKGARVLVFNGVFGDGYYQEIDGMTKEIEEKIKEGMQRELSGDGPLKSISHERAFAHHVADLAEDFEGRPFGV
jgi:hypothetical protein